MKKGIEIEYWVVDDDGKLSNAGDIIQELDYTDEELVKPLIELRTSPYEEFTELREEIKYRLRETLKAAERKNKKLVPLSTPLNSKKIEMIDSERFRIKEKMIGEEYRYAKRIAGTHIHIERENTKQQLNKITELDPLSSALSSSSYIEGEKIADSARNYSYRYWCYGEYPEYGQLWRPVNSTEEWKKRMEESYEKFVEIAEKAGIEKERINENFTVENSVWTPVRLREKFPTVEWKSSDANLPSRTLDILEKFSEVVARAEPLTADSEKIKQISKKAIKHGTKNREVRNYLKDRGFKDFSRNNLSEKLVSGEKISVKEAREKRLKAAKMLEKDLENFN